MNSEYHIDGSLEKQLGIKLSIPGIERVLLWNDSGQLGCHHKYMLFGKWHLT